MEPNPMSDPELLTSVLRMIRQGVNIPIDYEVLQRLIADHLAGGIKDRDEVKAKGLTKEAEILTHEWAEHVTSVIQGHLEECVVRSINCFVELVFMSGAAPSYEARGANQRKVQPPSDWVDEVIGELISWLRHFANPRGPGRPPAIQPGDERFLRTEDLLAEVERAKEDLKRKGKKATQFAVAEELNLSGPRELHRLYKAHGLSWKTPPTPPRNRQ